MLRGGRLWAGCPSPSPSPQPSSAWCIRWGLQTSRSIPRCSAPQEGEEQDGAGGLGGALSGCRGRCFPSEGVASTSPGPWGHLAHPSPFLQTCAQ